MFVWRTVSIALGAFLVGISIMSLEAADDPEVLLQSIRARTADYLSQLPNYTCHEVIHRLVRPASSLSLNHEDTIELEVAYVGNRELFAQPGASHFEEGSITRFASVGTIGNGAFGGHAQAVFAAAVFKYIGTLKKDGHSTFRYDFQVTKENSHYLVQHGSAQAIVGYRGSLWVDSDTLDLVRLEVKTDHIPRYVGIDIIQETIRYKRVVIRNTEFLLPSTSELAVTESSSTNYLNLVNLERCREFTGESAITYGGSAEKGSAGRAEPDR
jgi:hypothetical protein